MAHLALYRAFRPQTFDEVIAQSHIVYPLRQSVRNGSVNHALLFAGTRGTGKTSLAKIYAKAINCLNPQDGNPCNKCDICKGANDGSLFDILEMDAASNNSVDNIRKMTDEVIYTPVSATYKVYIIDEAHMLSSGAFNALLKTLEEPPAHAIFILATTEVHRIPATIASRCQRYDFRRIGLTDIVTQLTYIAAEEQIMIKADAVKTIASLADGAMRDAISLLDQVSGGVDGTISRQDVLDLVGLTSDEIILSLLQAIVTGQADRLLESIDDLAMAGRDLNRLTLDLAAHFRNLLVLKYASDASSVSQLPKNVRDSLLGLAPDLPTPRLIEIIRKLSELLSDLRFSGQPRTTLEIGLLALLALPVAESPGQAPVKQRQETANTTATFTPQPASKKRAPSASKSLEKESTPPVSPPTTVQSKAEKISSYPHTAVTPDDSPAEKTGEQEEKPKKSESALPVQAESETIAHLQLLDIWDLVLQDLSANNRMDLRLMAKSADVSLDDRVFTLRLKQGMQGAYQLLSKKDAIELLTTLVVKHLAKPVSVQIAIGNGESQASAEEEWLRTLRERT